MRTLFALLLVMTGFGTRASAQSCTGLCLQQVSCPNGGTTTISGTVYTPNGTDPLPDVLVYIPNASVAPFIPGVSCPVAGQPPSGSPLVGTTTAVDGTFTLANVPVGSNIPLVIQTGRWRRQVIVPGTAACTDTAFSTRMPRNQTEGDIPRFAIATGSADQVECVLRKVGIDDTEFTDPSGTGRINLYSGSGSAGARVDTATPDETAVMGNAATLNSYDVLMLPCQGASYTKPSPELANIIQFANSGGRIYSSHFSYVWMYQNPPWDGVAKWNVNQQQLPDGVASVDTTFPEGATLAQWLQLVGATSTQGQVAISTLKHDLDGVVPPTQSWLTLNDAPHNNPVMQLVFDAPVNTTVNHCGRVLFNEYHVENPVNSPQNKAFPSECPATPMNAQEKLLEFSLFELTSNGGVPTLTPAAQDFGAEAVGFSTAPQIFTWTNNSTFPASALPIVATGDFHATSNNCTTVPGGASCQIAVVFTPTAIGARSGTLTVGAGTAPLSSKLTGTGVPALVFSTSSIAFGNLDVGASATQIVYVVNNASGAVPVPSFATSGDFAAATNCGATLAGLSNCAVTVTFKPSTTGPRTGTLAFNSSSSAYASNPVVLTGNGIDFTLALTPTSGQVIAGIAIAFSNVTSPIAGFAANVALTCTTNAPTSTCVPAAAAFIPATAVTTAVAISTTSKYTVVGYAGTGGGTLWLVAIATGGLLWVTRRNSRRCLPLLILLFTAVSFAITGCSGKLPDQNPAFTAPGTYTYTLTATDGFLIHSVNYSLKVTAQ